jgi:hypothetical protein
MSRFFKALQRAGQTWKTWLDAAAAADVESACRARGITSIRLEHIRTDPRNLFQLRRDVDLSQYSTVIVLAGELKKVWGRARPWFDARGSISACWAAGVGIRHTLDFFSVASGGLDRCSHGAAPR